MEGQRERCAPHGLTVGPDGRCVLCRQQSAAPAQAMPGDAAPLRNPFVWTAIASALLGVAVGFGPEAMENILRRAAKRRAQKF